MAIAALVMLVLIFVLLYVVFFSSKEPTNETISAFPESGDRTDFSPEQYVEYVNEAAAPTSTALDESAATDEQRVQASTVPSELQRGNNSDWRNDVVSYGEQGVEGQPSSSEQASLYTEVTPYDDSLATEAVESLDYDYSKYYPELITLGDGTVMRLEDALNYEKFTDAVNPIPSLTDVFAGVESCGEIRFPASETAQKELVSNIDKNEVAICLGRAAVDDCKPARAMVYTPNRLEIGLYIARRDDGVCGIGNMLYGGYVDMCSLTKSLHLQSDTQGYDHLQILYADDPGRIVQDIITRNETLLGVENNDCVNYKI